MERAWLELIDEARASARQARIMAFTATDEKMKACWERAAAQWEEIADAYADISKRLLLPVDRLQIN